MEQNAETRRMLPDSEAQPKRKEDRPLKVAPPKKQKSKYRVVRGLIYASLTILAIICFIPFLMMIINATRTNGEVISGFTLIPGTALLDNYATLSEYINIWPDSRTA
ncbi:MAG: hypothetical protein ACOVQN_07585 [Exiguobacterium sp.]